jgi:hypothetical protein
MTEQDIWNMLKMQDISNKEMFKLPFLLFLLYWRYHPVWVLASSMVKVW